MNEVILNGSLLAALPLALLAGVISFLSPCILPLVPGYLAFVSGTASQKSRTVLGTLLFVLGFTLVFVALGTIAGGVGNFLAANSGTLQVVFGIAIILFGVVMLGGFSFMQRTAKFSVNSGLGLVGAFLLGLAFGFGWTPCIGPTLGSVITLSLDSATAGRGALLSFVYSLGIGLPFLAIAFGFGWATRSVEFVRKHIRAFNIAGGLMLIVLGTLMVTGVWRALTSLIQEVFGNFVPVL
ncbi:MAG: hypothetical protein RLZZ400_534 [Actinomycetota bacterium]